MVHPCHCFIVVSLIARMLATVYDAAAVMGTRLQKTVFMLAGHCRIRAMFAAHDGACRKSLQLRSFQIAQKLFIIRVGMPLMTERGMELTNKPGNRVLAWLDGWLNALRRQQRYEAALAEVKRCLPGLWADA